MKTFRRNGALLTALFVAALMAVSTTVASAQQMIDFAPGLEAVDAAVSDATLQATAHATHDPQVMLGLAFLTRKGSPARQELAAMAVAARPDYAPAAAVLALTMDGIDERSIDALIAEDPENALGYYLRGQLLHEADREAEALEAFRKAATCAELRLYESDTGPALLAALDALGLEGRERLCAIAWMAVRSSNFGAIGIQHAVQALAELGPPQADAGAREEVSDMLVVMAGHLFATSFTNRWYARRALEQAFRLKAEVAAAERSPKMNGYAAVEQALVSVTYSWPGISDGRDAYEVAQYMPCRVYEAFNVARYLDGDVNIPAGDKAAFEKAVGEASAAADVLINAAASDPDKVIGAYLIGLPRKPSYEDGPWVSTVTPVERLMREKPEVFHAAATFEEAADAVRDAAKGAPREANRRRLLEMGLGMLAFADRHDNAYPSGIDVLFRDKYLEPPLEARSLVTGRPYVYVAAGEKQPTKSSDAAQFVILYDDNSFSGWYDCLFADGHAGSVSAEQLAEQLAARGK